MRDAADGWLGRLPADTSRSGPLNGFQSNLENPPGASNTVSVSCVTPDGSPAISGAAKVGLASTVRTGQRTQNLAPYRAMKGRKNLHHITTQRVQHLSPKGAIIRRKGCKILHPLLLILLLRIPLWKKNQSVLAGLLQVSSPLQNAWHGQAKRG